MILLSPLNLRTKIFDFRFLINHNHVTLCRWTLIFRFLRVVWPELSDENLKNNFPRFYKISVLSRFRAITDFRFSVIGYSWWYTVHFYYHPLIKKRKHMSHSNPVFVPEILGLPSRNNQATVHEDEVDTFWGSIWLTPSIFSYDLYYFISLYFRISLKVLQVQKNASVGVNILTVTYHSSKFFKKRFH